MGSFDEEWSQIQAAAREQTAQTRLNGWDEGGSGPRDQLTVSWDAQRTAADDLERELLPDAMRAAGRPSEEWDQAARRMTGWTSAEAFRAVAASWVRKSQALDTQLRAEAEALRATASDFEGQDLAITYQFRSINGME